jgi:hypothetical protein
VASEDHVAPSLLLTTKHGDVVPPAAERILILPRRNRTAEHTRLGLPRLGVVQRTSLR